MKSARPKASGQEIGTPIAVLRLEPEDFVARGVVARFKRDHDDLDYVKVAWLGDNIALVRYPRSPKPGTEVVVSDFKPGRGARTSRELDELLRSLRLSKRDVAWLHPELRRSRRS